jgi:1-acyl-sn-glycerol-3-phosphate acyltransferase
MKRAIGRLVLRALRYRMVGEAAPTNEACVLVAAPHTSWLDFPLMLGIAWSNDLSPGWLGKKELFRAPFGGVMRALGGVAVDRDDPGVLVADLVARARSGTGYALVVAPEGTRGRAERWKSGFYRIATDAGVPIVLTYLDGPSRTGGFGPRLVPTGDVRADMDLIRQYYSDKHGVVPARRTVPSLREEEGGRPG